MGPLGSFSLIFFNNKKIDLPVFLSADPYSSIFLYIYKKHSLIFMKNLSLRCSGYLLVVIGVLGLNHY